MRICLWIVLFLALCAAGCTRQASAANGQRSVGIGAGFAF